MNPLVRTWPHPAAPAQSQRCPESPNLLTNREKQALLLGMPFEIAEIAGGQSCDFTSLLIILTIWVLLSILFPAFPAFHFPLSLPSSYSSSRCWLKMFDWKGATCFRWERFQTIWMHEVLWPHARANPGVHPLAFGLEPAGFSSQWAALPTNSLTTLAPSTACFKIEE